MTRPRPGRMARVLELFTPARPDRGIAVLWILIASIFAAVVFVFDPTASRYYPDCPFRSITGLLCPGCGSTRAVHHLLHGDILAAIKLNPLLLIVGPILGYAAVSTVALAVRGRPLPRPRVSAVWIWLLLAVIVVFWVLRNTPWWW